MARARRGQAELIAATIAISVFVLVVVFMILSITATGYVSTSALAERARFENERQLEKLAYTYDPATWSCTITNAGAVEIRIVRAWNYTGADFTIDGSFSYTLKPGESITLPYSDWNSIAYVVTARGNVFPVQGRCWELGTRWAGVPPYISRSFLTSDVYYINPNKPAGILCTVSNTYYYKNGQIDGSSYGCYILYYNAGTWLVNDGTKWSMLDESKNYINIINNDPDLDGNEVNELISSVIDRPNTYTETYFPNLSYRKPPDLKYSDHLFNVTFLNVLQITPETDVITVYYRLVIYPGSWKKDAINVTINVGVYGSGGDALVFSSEYDIIERLKIKKGKGIQQDVPVIVIQGSATIPRKAYQSLYNVLKPGTYSLSLLISLRIIDPEKWKDPAYIRIEMIAISGAKINW